MSCVEVPNQRGSDCALANQVALTLYEGDPLANSIWSHRIWELPKQKMYGTWSERVSFSTKHNVDLVSKIGNKLYVVKVILLKHPPCWMSSLRRSRGKFFENIFSSPKKVRTFWLGKKEVRTKWEHFCRSQKKSENIGETIWAGLVCMHAFMCQMWKKNKKSKQKCRIFLSIAELC